MVPSGTTSQSDFPLSKLHCFEVVFSLQSKFDESNSWPYFYKRWNVYFGSALRNNRKIMNRFVNPTNVARIARFLQNPCLNDVKIKAINAQPNSIHGQGPKNKPQITSSFTGGK